MSEGLMWQTDNFIDEVQCAARRFRERYGRRPNICRMHRDTIQKAAQCLEEKYGQHKAHCVCEGKATVYGIRIVRDGTITRGHFLLCYEEVKK